MIRFGLLLLLTIQGFIVGCAASPVDTTRSTPKEKSLLWKISGNGLKKPSYLFGTIHLLCAKDYVWTPAMRRALQLSDQVCFEMDMDDPKVMMDIGMGMLDVSGKTLQDYFTKEQYDSLSRYFTDSLSLNIAMLQQAKPAALLSLFATKMADCDNPVSYESRIQDEAKKSKKEIIGLEEPREQIALLDSIPVDSIVADVMEAISGKDQMQINTYYALIAAYKKQDLNALDSLINEEQRNTDNLYAFLGERNEKWISRMEEQMEQRAIFFAVGAGHLGGKDGVISLLRAAGYTVKAVR